MDFLSDISEEKIAHERRKARELRQSQWWKNRKGKGLCYYCRRPFHPSELTMDHIVPVIRGGKSVKSNVVPCCKECNNKKKHMLPSEWGEYLEGLKT
ncbi:MAG: HNH endonuclease [Deltaproteobacteria bacterium]|nr:HNH endonuclease [Deltaproteobacteria bacterium]